MKKLMNVLFGSLVTTAFYYAFYLAILFLELNVVVEPHYFVVLAIALAFCFSSLTFVSAKIDFAIGQNLSYISIILPTYVYYSTVLSDFLSYSFAFLFLFSIALLIHYLFFNKDLEEKFLKQISALAIFSVLSVLNVLLHISFF